MKCIILAAGYGTRLYPLTKTIAKPLIPINGVPILSTIVEKVNQLDDIDSIYVVTNNKFYADIVNWSTHVVSRIPLTVLNDGTMSNTDRLGAIGDIHFVVKDRTITDDLLVIGGDNLFEDDLTDFLQFFKRNGSTILVNDVGSKELAKLYGIVTVNAEHQIIRFVEKPEEPESTLASTLIYALKKEHLPLLQEVIDRHSADRAGDFIQYLSENEQVFALPLQGRWFDIGSFEQLKEAERLFRKG
jgi:glucose-1-phosphate thymidylyltransferase